MASLASHHSSISTKLLFLGDSGMGKTGALASLALAGYNLRVMDFDNGLDVLVGLLRPGVAPYNLTPEQSAAAIARIEYVTLTDTFKAMGGRMFPTASKAWGQAVGLLSKWKGPNPDDLDLGPVDKWGPKDVLVVDSLTFAGKAAVRFILSLNGKLAATPQWTDYFAAQQLVESMLAMLYSESIKCNVVVLAHVREIGKKQTIEKDGKAITVEEEGSRRGYAETGTGSALSPNVGRYFNGVVLADIVGDGAHARREIHTVPRGNIGLKTPAPGLVKPVYKLHTGLADYFAAVRGESPAATTAAIPS